MALVKVAILLNPHSGSLDRETCQERATEILAAFRQRGIAAEAHPCEGARLTQTARTLASRGDLDAIVAAGGDGTVSAVAAGMVAGGGHGVLGVLPLGTLNHFAKDIGVKDLASGIDAIARGETRRIDVGEVNGRVFINNSSIGLYPELVRERDQQRGGKWRAMLRAAWRILIRFPMLHVAIAFAGRVLSARTPVVFVGNNEYDVDLRSLGVRKRLDAGSLSVYTVRVSSRLRMLWVAIRELLQRGDPPDIEVHAVERADIVANKRMLEVAVDGEVVRLQPPLMYRSLPGALRVYAPA